MRRTLAAMLVSAGSLVPIAAGAAGAAPEPSSAPKPASGPTTSSPTLASPGGATTTTVPQEIPEDEATLAGLLAEVKTRLSQLSASISSLSGQIGTNQHALDAADAALAASQAQAYTADLHLDGIEVARAAARIDVRDRAIAAFIHQPTGDLANMLLHLSDPAELVDARNFYRTIVDVQEEAIKRYDSLDKAASGAAVQANKAQDDAAKLAQTVSQQQTQLQALRSALQGIEVASNQQEQQETQLQSQVGVDRAQFEAELAAQEQESASIAALLASLSTPGEGTASPGAGGYFAVPIPGAPITQRFGPSTDPFTGAPSFHPGIDFGARTGTPIHAAGNGTVVYAGEESGYGNYTCIDHGQNVATCYGHQSAILVQVGQQVTRGEVIGLVGSTGYSTGPHLHFEVRIHGTPVDPLPWITPAPPGATTSTTGLP